MSKTFEFIIIKVHYNFQEKGKKIKSLKQIK